MIGGACRKYGREKWCVQDLFGKHKRRNYLEDLGVNGRIILKCIFKKWDEGHELD